MRAHGVVASGGFVSSFVSRRAESHVFSAIVSHHAESSEMLKTGQKREK
jgi:hypothetical protein